MVSYQRDAEPDFPLNPSAATNRILGNDDIFYDGAGNIVQVGLAPSLTMSYDRCRCPRSPDGAGG